MLSIVIPAKNEAARVAHTLADAFALAPCEVILVDGGSDDDTASLAEEAGARVLHSEPGRGRQLRCGAEQATGDLLLFLHADMRFGPELRGQIDDAFADESVLCAGFDHRIDADGRRYRMIEAADRRRARRSGILYGDQGIVIRRNIYEALGGFESIPLMEDVRLLRAFRRRYRIRPELLPGPLIVSARRWQKLGVIRTTLLNAFFRNAERLGVSPERLARWYGAALRPRVEGGG